MPNLDELTESIDARILELNDEISALQAAKAALLQGDADTSPAIRRKKQATRTNRARTVRAPRRQSPATAATSDGGGREGDALTSFAAGAGRGGLGGVASAAAHAALGSGAIGVPIARIGREDESGRQTGEAPSNSSSYSSSHSAPTRTARATRRARIAAVAGNGASANAATNATTDAEPGAAKTASKADVAPKSRRRGRRAPATAPRRVEVLLAGKLEVMLGESEDGLSASAIATSARAPLPASRGSPSRARAGRSSASVGNSPHDAVAANHRRGTDRRADRRARAPQHLHIHSVALALNPFVVTACSDSRATFSLGRDTSRPNRS